MFKAHCLDSLNLLNFKDDDDWVKQCRAYVNGDWGHRQRRCPRKSWCDCVRDDMRSFGLTRELAQDKVEWRVRIKGHPANPRLPGNWPLKWYACEFRFHKFCIT